MKNILLIVGILLAGGSVYWGMTLSDDLKKSGEEKVALVDENRKQQANLSDMSANLSNSLAAQSVAINKEAAASSELQRAMDENSTLTTELEGLKVQLAEVEKQLEDLLKGADGRDPDDMLAKAGELKSAIEEKEGQATELAAVLQGAKDKLVPLEAHLAKLQQSLATYDRQVARNNEEYSITAVDPQWGFVIVNAGQNSGLEANELLLVTRGGKRQAVLKISRVEKGQSVADIQQDSLKPGNKLQVGDKVILLRPRG